MKKITIAFDVDGTLINNKYENKYVANENIRDLLICLSKFKNTKIIVWSGAGEFHARQAVRLLGLEEYVDLVTTKNHLGKVDGVHKFDPALKPDIAIDDIQACELGVLNLIVRQK